MKLRRLETFKTYKDANDYWQNVLPNIKHTIFNIANGTINASHEICIKAVKLDEIIDDYITRMYWILRYLEENESKSKDFLYHTAKSFKKIYDDFDYCGLDNEFEFVTNDGVIK